MVAGNNKLVILICPSFKRHPYLNVGVVLCVLLGIMLLPHAAMGDIGQIRVRDSFRSNTRSQYFPVHKAKKIETRADAEVYLRHYGYLNCSDDEASRQKRQLIPEGLIEGGDNNNPDPCEEEDYIKALRKFQRKHEIPITGVLDTLTKEKMMEGRCGNPDPVDDDDDDEINQKTPNGRNTGSNSDPPSNAPAKRSKRDVEEINTTQYKSSHSGIRNWIISWLGMDEKEKSISLEEVDISDLGVLEINNEIPDSVHWHLVPEGVIIDEDNPSLLNIILNPHKRKKRKKSRRTQMYNDIRENIVSNVDIHKDGRKLESKHVISSLFNDGSQKKRRHRQKRNQRFNESTYDSSETVNHKWNGPPILTYKILQGSDRIPTVDVCTTVALAFRMWAEVTNLDFRPLLPGQDIKEVQIFGAFGKGQHLDCDDIFDGSGGEIAHSKTKWSISSFHIDDEENFKAYPRTRNDGIPLLLTVIHEIGHVLGLDHLFSSQSVMYPTLTHELYSSDFELSPRDREAIQNIYGRCTGYFNGIIDWLHTDPEMPGGLNCITPCVCESQAWQYYTYLFRDDKFWLYLNNYQRPRYGDPLYIVERWHNLPTEIDAVVQTTKTINSCKGKAQYQLESIFFSGDKYYLYNDIEDTVISEGLLSDRFGPKEGQSTTVPSNLDAVLFDPRDSYLYFFKDTWVGVVNPFDENSKNGSCCVRQHNFSDYFRFNASAYRDYNGTEAVELNGYVDSVYLKYSMRAIYFFKNKYVYKADIGPKDNNGMWTDQGPVNLTFEGEWNKMWYDLCDVHTSVDTFCSVYETPVPWS